jgi:hypothetical protein
MCSSLDYTGVLLLWQNAVAPTRRPTGKEIPHYYHYIQEVHYIRVTHRTDSSVVVRVADIDEIADVAETTAVAKKSEREATAVEKKAEMEERRVERDNKRIEKECHKAKEA